jgi:hypothetical protein
MKQSLDIKGVHRVTRIHSSEGLLNENPLDHEIDLLLVLKIHNVNTISRESSLDHTRYKRILYNKKKTVFLYPFVVAEILQ